MRVLVVFTALISAVAMAADGPTPAPQKSPTPPIKVCAMMDKDAGFGACELPLAVCLFVKGAGLNCWLKQQPAPAPDAKDKK